MRRITSMVLVAVLLALGWIVLAAYLPQAIPSSSQEAEVVVVLVLLLLALLLVSILALQHTRPRRQPDDD